MRLNPRKGSAATLALMVSALTLHALPAEAVVGGNPAEPSQFPCMVSLEYQAGDWHHLCGGTLIGESLVLTAATCLAGGMNADRLRIRAGVTNLNGPDQGVVAKVHDYKVDLALNQGEETMANNVAVLRLDSPVKLGGNVMACAVSDTIPEPGAKCRVAGWGNAGPNEPLSPHLRWADLTLLSNRDGAELLGKLGPGVGPSQFLIHSKGAATTNPFDWGGGVYCEEHDRLMVNGIVSFNFHDPDSGAPNSSLPIFANRLSSVVHDYDLYVTTNPGLYKQLELGEVYWWGAFSAAVAAGVVVWAIDKAYDYFFGESVFPGGLPPIPQDYF